jgi:3-deoxy-manno-octulosonate cytidylyltransferase (CMP-KDO synthetase)
MKMDSNYKFCAIIPARYASTRFPGKPLAMIGDKTMIHRVYEQTQKSIQMVYVATDDVRIREEVIRFGGNVVMTDNEHQSGTDRCAEAVEKISALTGKSFDIIVNIQGDEPFIKPEQIDLLKSCFDDKSVKIATLIRKTKPGEDIFNPNQPKVVTDISGNAIYFSRAVIPFHRDAEEADWTVRFNFFKHVGLYAYTSLTLKKITLLKSSPLEIAESLEQNRWIENGLKIRTVVTEWESIGIDTPDDLERAISSLDHIL